MLQTPDPRHWWQLVFISPVSGRFAGSFITEADCVDVAIARAELAGVRPAGCHLSAAPFRATTVHPDYLDILMTEADFAAMPMPAGFQQGA